MYSLPLMEVTRHACEMHTTCVGQAIGHLKLKNTFTLGLPLNILLFNK